MPRPKPEPLTVEQIRAQVNEEIPYVVGEGTSCITRRTRRMKELMKKHGHKIEHNGAQMYDLGSYYPGGW